MYSVKVHPACDTGSVNVLKDFNLNRLGDKRE